LQFYILLISFFFIALAYSSVGFGGGSSYLALLAILAVSFEVLRPTALLCNIVVVTGGSLIFFKEGYLDLKKSWPILVASVPMAFLGGYFPIKKNTFFLLLAVALIVAAFLIWFQTAWERRLHVKSRAGENVYVKLGLGGGIGFLSGMVSIGGGIFLSPLLHLIRWDDAKRISALASIHSRQLHQWPGRPVDASPSVRLAFYFAIAGRSFCRWTVGVAARGKKNERRLYQKNYGGVNIDCGSEHPERPLVANHLHISVIRLQILTQDNIVLNHPYYWRSIRPLNAKTRNEKKHVESAAHTRYRIHDDRQLFERQFIRLVRCSGLGVEHVAGRRADVGAVGQREYVFCSGDAIWHHH